MTPQHLVLALGIVSVMIALEGAWLTHTIKANEYLDKLKKSPIETLIRAFYFLGLPYLALINGLLPGRLFGLKGLEFFYISDTEIARNMLTQGGQLLLSWLPDFGPMANISALIGAIFLFYLWLYLRAISNFETKQGEKTEAQEIKHIYAFPAYYSKVNMVFDVVHWSFYRAIGWLILDSLYLGVIGGLVVILFEYSLASRFGKFSYELQQQYVLRFALGLISTLTFLFVPNLWFTLIFHLVLATISTNLLRGRPDPKGL